VRFHHNVTVYDKTKVHFGCGYLETSPEIGIIDTSLATSDILTWHQMTCSQINLWCLMFSQQTWCGLVIVFVFHISSHFRTKI